MRAEIRRSVAWQRLHDIVFSGQWRITTVGDNCLRRVVILWWERVNTESVPDLLSPACLSCVSPDAGEHRQQPQVRVELLVPGQSRLETVGEAECGVG